MNSSITQQQRIIPCAGFGSGSCFKTIRLISLLTLLYYFQHKLTHKINTTIDEEFDSIREMANIEVTEMDIETRTCQIHSERNGYVAHLQVNFPKNVIEQAIPKFSWLSGTNIDSCTTIKILQAINKMAYRKKKEGQRCLLHCLKTLATSIDEVSLD